jgi:hypothetical protein
MPVAADQMTSQDICAYFGWTHRQWRETGRARVKFPRPVSTPEGDSVWLRREIETWGWERNLPDPTALFQVRLFTFWDALFATVGRFAADANAGTGGIQLQPPMRARRGLGVMVRTFGRGAWLSVITGKSQQLVVQQWIPDEPQREPRRFDLVTRDAAVRVRTEQGDLDGAAFASWVCEAWRGAVVRATWNGAGIDGERL